MLTANISRRALYLYLNISRYCLDYVINLDLIYLLKDLFRVKLLGARVRIIAGIAHLLVVERSYPNHNKLYDFRLYPLIDNPYRDMLRCKFTYIF